MKNVEKILKALANKRRLHILKYLNSEHKAKVGDIAKEIKLSFKSTSRHLGVLFNAELVEKDQVSLMVFYRLSQPTNTIVKKILNAL